MQVPARVNVLGVGISALNMLQAVAIIGDWIARRERHYVCAATVHGVMECQKDDALRRVFNNSGLTIADGMPMVWMSWLQGFREASRVYGPDLMLALCGGSASRQYRHYFYGGDSGVPELLKAALQARFPRLQVVGTYSPPFRPLTPDEDDEVVARINAAQPDILWVGLGAPKQDIWTAEHVARLDVPVTIGVGAAFDFLSGRKRQAPLWMRGIGLEWLFRLATEPRRLWRRYLIYNPLFLLKASAQLLGLRRYTLD